jgi:AcrR family transcriptional regulator
VTGQDTPAARRRETTRGRIMTAANELFAVKGYDDTSMDDISRAANVALRTIYLHFSSKAGIFLSFLDAWVDEFVDRIVERPIDEHIADSVAAALAGLREAGWPDDRIIAETSAAHPIVSSMGGGSSDIAGHVLQTWVLAQDRLVDSFQSRGTYPLTSLEPRLRATAVFTAWLTSILVFRDADRGRGVSPLSSHEIGEAAIRAFGDGIR